MTVSPLGKTQFNIHVTVSGNVQSVTFMPCRNKPLLNI